MSDYTQGRLLVAHHEPNSCRALCEMLRKAGHEVILAEDGLAAVDLASELLPDLVILSVNLPKLSGVHACERLHGDRDTAAIPVIMISDSNEPMARTQSMEAGAVDHVCSPLDLESLRFQVSNLVRLRRQRRVLESRLAKTERRERMRDEWVTYAVHEMEQSLLAVVEETPSVSDALDLVQSILACGQMSHPKALVTLRSCELSKLAAELDLAKASSDFQGEVQADPEMLTRTLRQLARAAWDQSPQKELPTLHLGGQGEDRLTIEVRAESSGIWHESYATLDQGCTASQGLDCQNRLELSLSFCKHAMDLMGGTIGVNTGPENGLRFWLTLPAAAPEILPNIVPFTAELLPFDTAASR